MSTAPLPRQGMAQADAILSAEGINDVKLNRPPIFPGGARGGKAAQNQRKFTGRETKIVDSVFNSE